MPVDTMATTSAIPRSFSKLFFFIPAPLGQPLFGVLSRFVVLLRHRRPLSGAIGFFRVRTYRRREYTLKWGYGYTQGHGCLEDRRSPVPVSAAGWHREIPQLSRNGTLSRGLRSRSGHRRRAARQS